MPILSIQNPAVSGFVFLFFMCTLSVGCSSNETDVQGNGPPDANRTVENNQTDTGDTESITSDQPTAQPESKSEPVETEAESTADATAKASMETTEQNTESDSLYSPEAFCKAAHDGKLRVVQVCLESGMDVNLKNADGICPLTMAAYNGHSDVVRLLIKNSAVVDAVDRSGMTPLIHAASCPEPSAPETVKILIEAGANMGAVGGQENWTALMMAASEGNLEVVKVLLSKGAKKDTADTDGETAADFAREHGHAAIIKLLESE